MHVYKLNIVLKKKKEKKKCSTFTWQNERHRIESGTGTVREDKQELYHIGTYRAVSTERK